MQWSPSTCGCTVTYVARENVDAHIEVGGPRSNQVNVTLFISPCELHDKLGGVESIYDAVVAENQRVATVMRLVHAEIPDVDITEIPWQINEETREIKVDLPVKVSKLNRDRITSKVAQALGKGFKAE